MKTLKSEEVNGKDYTNLEDARGQIGAFIETVYLRVLRVCIQKAAGLPQWILAFMAARKLGETFRVVASSEFYSQFFRFCSAGGLEKANDRESV